MKKNNICIVGHFGGNRSFTDGQTVKTKYLYNALLERSFSVDKVDTFFVNTKPLFFIFQLMKNIIKNDVIIFLLSKNGRKILFPFFYFVHNISSKRFFHYAIGGSLAREVIKNPRFKKYVAYFSGNWVESKKLVNELREVGVENSCYVPNFKKIKPIEDIEVNDKFKFCTFSRVILEKGIEDAINAIESLKNKYTVSLDIYGPIPDDYKKRFFEILKYTECCHYKGSVSPDESVNILKDYYCLLFPTFWKAEGMPGTIIDAFASGLPVIARRWPLCDELITDGKTGLVYDFDKPELLVEKIEYAIAHKDEIFNMKMNCLNESKKYSEEVVITQIIDLLGK